MVGADVYFHTRARSHTAAQEHRAAVPGREVARVAVSGARGPAAAGVRGGGSAWRARGRGLGFVAGVVLRAPPTPRPHFLCSELISNIAPRAAACNLIAFVLVVSARGRDGQGGRERELSAPRYVEGGEEGFPFSSKQ